MKTSAPRPPAGQKSSIGLDASLAAMLAYAGFFLFSGVAFLILEKESRFVRFHAMQSVLVAVALAVLYAFLGTVPLLALLSPLVWLGSVVLWLFLMFKAYRGESYKVPVLGDIAQHFVAR